MMNEQKYLSIVQVNEHEMAISCNNRVFLMNNSNTLETLIANLIECEALGNHHTGLNTAAPAVTSIVEADLDDEIPF